MSGPIIYVLRNHQREAKKGKKTKKNPRVLKLGFLLDASERGVHLVTGKHASTMTKKA